MVRLTCSDTGGIYAKLANGGAKRQLPWGFPYLQPVCDLLRAVNKRSFAKSLIEADPATDSGRHRLGAADVDCPAGLRERIPQAFGIHRL
jgi:hypothetical protein